MHNLCLWVREQRRKEERRGLRGELRHSQTIVEAQGREILRLWDALTEEKVARRVLPAIEGLGMEQIQDKEMGAADEVEGAAGQEREVQVREHCVTKKTNGNGCIEL